MASTNNDKTDLKDENYMGKGDVSLSSLTPNCESSDKDKKMNREDNQEGNSKRRDDK